MKKYISAFLLAITLLGCNEDKFLEETPLDFMGGDNSYSTVADYEAATAELYYLVRKEFYGDYSRSMDFIQGTDMMITSDPLKSNLSSDLNPTGGIASYHWNTLYLLVSQSNVALSRLHNASLTNDQKLLYEAKARFFRGFAYRTLAYLYGGVPLQLEEVTAPKTDYTRNTKAEVMAQAISDVEFASKNLPDISEVRDGEISASAAYFLLSELYLAVGENQKAVDAATTVIDNPALELMKNRFGSRKSEPGDVYWDLFRINNQNRLEGGNTEGIWVIQEEADVPGGAAKTSEYFWSTSSFWLERFCAPQVGLFRFAMPDGTKQDPFSWPIGDYTGGRGIGTMYATNHFYRTVWGDGTPDFKNDIRNSIYNYPRKFKFNNPAFVAKYGNIFGDSIDLENPQLPEGVTLVTGYDGGVASSSEIPNRFLCGYQTKCTTPFNHPDAQYLNKSTYLLSGSGGKTYTDQYMFRLSEAYLLRAEAYLKLENKQKAADDINEVRSRANASPVSASEVDIDYILDERLREFGIEEKRRLTLVRTGKLYERVTKYNPYYNAQHSSDAGYQKKYELYPIPQSVIEANKDAILEQNPEY